MSTRALELGTLVHARYRVERILGEGGFGVTYLVSDLKENRIAAMKEYMPADIAYRRRHGKEVQPKSDSVSAYQAFRDKFLEEARTIYRFRGHPNIIDVNHLFYDNNTAYYVMEYIDGKDLDKHLKECGGRIAWGELKAIMSQVAAALQAVHNGNTVHCDISPDNIFLLDGGQVKLIDFGAAKSVLGGNSTMVLLKRGFAPPEQMRAGGNIGPWSDVYAMAVTIYRAYTGKMPPTAEDRLVSDQTVWPSQMGIPAPSAQWENVLRKAMCLNWQELYQDVAAFWQELSACDEEPWREPEYPKYPEYPDVTWQDQQVLLEGLQGLYAGVQLMLRDPLIIGTDWNRCNLQYPPQTPGVSRLHMKIWEENGTAYAMDAGSTYGTWIGDRRMAPGLVYPLQRGTVICFGDGQYFRIR